jgi:hypothetical protein
VEVGRSAVLPAAEVVGVEPPIDLGKIKASGEKLDIPGHRFAEREEDGELPGGCKRERRNFG